MFSVATVEEDVKGLGELRDALSLNANQVAPFTGEEEVFMFARAVSRLTEMQSEEYLRMKHLHSK